MRSRVRLSVLALLCATATATADPAPDYSGFKLGKFLSYTNAPPSGVAIAAPPQLSMSLVPGQPHTVVMDTGSTAIVVSADQVPSLAGTPCTGCLTYSSSGRIYTGVWVTLPVTIAGGNDATVTTVPIPILAVTRITCTAKPRHCKTMDHPSGVDMMGVGFGREYDGQPDGTPGVNPFLNIADSTGAPMRRGYVMTHSGVHVGLTRANTRGTFNFVKLQRYPGSTDDWSAPQACTTVVDRAAPCGPALIDTGVTSMFLTVPANTVEGHTSPGSNGSPELSAGTSLSFTFPGSDGSVAAAYGFVVGAAGNPLAPDAVILNTIRSPFVNTGVDFLNGFDVLYDADGGYVAFRTPQDEGSRP